jgi:hypothetical protein
VVTSVDRLDVVEEGRSGLANTGVTASRRPGQDTWSETGSRSRRSSVLVNAIRPAGGRTGRADEAQVDRLGSPPAQASRRASATAGRLSRTQLRRRHPAAGVSRRTPAHSDRASGRCPREAVSHGDHRRDGANVRSFAYPSNARRTSASGRPDDGGRIGTSPATQPPGSAVYRRSRRRPSFKAGQHPLPAPSAGGALWSKNLP